MTSCFRGRPRGLLAGAPDSVVGAGLAVVAFFGVAFFPTFGAASGFDTGVTDKTS